MRAFIFICILSSMIACKGKAPHAKVSDAVKSTPVNNDQDTAVQTKMASKDTFNPFKLIGDYTVTDTGDFDFAIGNGTYAVVKNKNRLVDTIDYLYKFQPVDNDMYAYYRIDGHGPAPVESGDMDPRSITADIGSYIIIDRNGMKIDVNKTAPDFGWFASPSIINGLVYYWQVKQVKDHYLVSAAQFNPKTLKTKSIYLFSDNIETDDGGYFKQAESENGLTVFTSPPGKKYNLSDDFKLVK